MDQLATRQKLYEEAYDIKIIKRLPIMIRLDGRSFTKLTRKIDRPYDIKMMDIMANTMLLTIMEIEGALFGYQQSDEITIILRNDQTFESQPWFANRIQKMCSIAASIATLSFNKYYTSLEEKPNLIGDALFDARVFAVPSLSEVVNNLIFRQQDCIRNAITSAAQTELGKKFGRKTAYEILEKRNIHDRLLLLKTQCNIDFDNIYPTCFKRGIGAYKVPTFINEISRNKWTLDYEIPIFAQDKNFVMNILNSGHDLYRAKVLDIKE